jgi:hypothetical protein
MAATNTRPGATAGCLYVGEIVLVDVSVVVPILKAMKSLAEPPLLRLARFLVRPLLKALFCQVQSSGFGTPGSARLILAPPARGS